MSETTNLKLFKNDNPATNTNDFDVDKSLNQNWDKLDNFAGIVIENVETVQTNIDTLEETLKTENEQLRKDVESSNIENTVEGQIITTEDNSTLESKIQLLGNTEQEVTEQGKNLLDPYLQDKTVNGITVSYNQSSQEITLNGTCTTDNTGIVFSKFTPVNLNANELIYSKVKYISGSCTGGNNCTFGIFDASWSKSLTIKLGGITKDMASNISFASDVVENRVQIRFDKGDVANNLKIKVMVSKQNVAYEPFIPTKPSFKYQSEINNVSGNIEINVSNKNMIYLEKDTTVSKYGITAKTDVNNRITLNGTASRAIYINLSDTLRVSNYDEASKWQKEVIKAGQYNLSFQNISGNSSSSNINAFLRQGVSGEAYASLNKISEKTEANTNLTLSQDSECNLYLWIESGAVLDNFSFDIMLKKNTGLGPYVVGEKQKITFPLTEGQILHKDDYLANDGIHHKRKTHVFNGTENWIWSNSSDNYIGFVLDLEVDSSSELYCNKLKTYPIAQINGVDKQGIAYRNNNTGLYIRIERTLLPAQTLAGFKQYLSENNITVEVGLLNEEIEEYTETQKQVYDKLQKIRAYKPITNIWTNQNGVIKYTYKRDLETYISQKLGGN